MTDLQLSTIDSYAFVDKLAQMPSSALDASLIDALGEIATGKGIVFTDEQSFLDGLDSN